MRQLFAYRTHDPQKKLSGIVLEVKGDLCRQLRKILQDSGREPDYIEVGLQSDIRYNPLNNDLDLTLRPSTSPRSSPPSGAEAKNHSGSSPIPIWFAM